MALKEEILKLLNEDEEFRRQIENILGLNVIKTINELAQNVNQLTQRVDQLTQTVNELGQRIDQLAKNQEVLQRLVGEVTQSVNQLIKRQDSFISKIERMDKVLGSIGSRWSSLYESLITDFLREFLEKEGLDYNCVNKFSFKDDKGIYGFKGRKYEIDILAKEDKVYMIEVKYSAEDKDVEWFDIRCKVIREVLGLTKQPVKLFLAITAKKDAVDRANELGIKMIAEDIFEIPKKK